jgi:hypothetical protein
LLPKCHLSKYAQARSSSPRLVRVMLSSSTTGIFFSTRFILRDTAKVEVTRSRSKPAMAERVLLAGYAVLLLVFFPFAMF